MEYRERHASLEASGPALVPGSAEEQQAVERFQALLSDFTAPGFGAGIREVYAEDVWFNDTLKTVRGVDALAEYLTGSAAAVESCTVEFLDLAAQNGDYYFRWAMDIRFKKIARGKTTRSIGMSHIRFDADGRVVLHQDFWDSTGGLFEHVPALGWMIRRIKKRL